MSDLDRFRAETREWLEANCPAEMRHPIRSEADLCWGGRNWAFQSDAQKRWLEVMADRGWTVPEWPKDYGGGGLTPVEGRVLKQEMARIGARSPLTSFGISMLGPALLKFGTEEQKRHYLPQIARGEIRWCQGYSEPGAGSDLAGLQTKAEDKGDHWLVNGQKVWTSYADKADWIFCLVRTSSESKQGGISFLLFDMLTPGVSTKPILLISGSSPFCETFFDDVKVPKGQIVGEVNRGWDVAKYLLGHEREMIAGMGLGSGIGTGGTSNTLGGWLTPADPMLRADIAAFDVDALAFAAMSERFAAMWKAGEAHPASPSMMKYAGTELNKQRMELVIAAGGSDALEWDSERSNNGKAPRDWLRSKGNSIEGGTSEIQLNIVAKHILGLPGA
ncbi:acyl-CoA dehydrogenase family protein [Sphingomonas hankyongi]|uniref:Acyl-CoA dehydrogenase family protein n=1 Tax=Sphingomonas hankyongi TaxID=2908209 RepID=A0ABT0RZ11_9SPHN|nr:acyl-CoA dehydrogenase family protein [Sphingomonas hankyongi]MCL6728827.1 acyl-CoA dehydrogenase family protein [Sphingomonas hankyongi]